MKFPLIRQGEGPIAALQRILEEREREQKKRDRAMAIADADIPDPDQRRHTRTPAGDERRLRGIPAIGRGVTGAIPGTRPGSSPSDR